MTLASGSRIGPYEIQAPIGAGGMGEVYRARDSKLDRDVAVKVLPAHLNESPDALARFEREAKAVAALSHPGILAIYDFGAHEGRAYAVMELLEGETLRERLASGALPTRKAVEVGAQIARGLAAAHDKGIVHRDLKPENLFLTTDGRVKILDFGLARARAATAAETISPTLTRPTDPGTVLGTAGYMSPEQVRGNEADHRSDIFSLGCVLHEMLTGRRAFARETAAETMTAILKEDPPEVAESGVTAPPSLERLVRHCLEKRPEERFQSVRDVAFDLETILTPSEKSGASPVRGTRVAASKVVGLAAAAAIAAALALGLWLGRRTGVAVKTGADPSFTRLSFGQGTVWSARFAPDGKTIVYAAAWDGQPIRLFSTQTDSTESTPLNLPDAQLLSVSSAGELAISLGHRYEGWMGAGTLARSPLRGGGARPVLEGVREADWSPDGSDLALVRRVGGIERLEFPAGKVLYETGGWLSHIRFSPKGDRIAFADHHLWGIAAAPTALVVTDQSTQDYAVCLRPIDGSPPVRLGEGDGYGLSPDGRWVLAATPRTVPRAILLHPTGPGQSRELKNPEGLRFDFMRWLPDGRIVMFATAPGRGHRRGYVLDPEGGAPRPFTDPDVEPVRYWAIPVSPDGSRVVARDAQGRLNAYRVDGGEPEPIQGISPLDLPLEWAADGRALFVTRLGELPWRIRRHELASGRETPWTEVAPGQMAGARLSWVFLTPDGRSWLHSYSRLLIDLYVADGLR